ncbi:MAG: hypothetical protein L7S59_07445, partial [Pseudomonadales bacterium]|nr:hypothetical protein [Pseudomonadales bacterium]
TTTTSSPSAVLRNPSTRTFEAWYAQWWPARLPEQIVPENIALGQIKAGEICGYYAAAKNSIVAQVVDGRLKRSASHGRDPSSIA